MRRIFICAAAFVFACNKGEHGHEHPHGSEHQHGHEHGHGHGPVEPPGQSLTAWTEKTELFAEYPPLMIGRESGFAAHVTVLDGFKPLTAGAVSVTLSFEAGGAPLVGRVEAASSPGIFRPVVKPDRGGKCTLRFSVRAPNLTDELDGGPCEVFDDEEDARIWLEDEEPEKPGRISFTKEQQWKTAFATAIAGERELEPSIAANGEIQPAAGKEARLVATTRGRLALAAPPPVLGMPVTKGQVLATIAARLDAAQDRASLEAEVAAARAELETARAARARADRLLAEQAIAEKQLEEARTAEKVAAARATAAEKRLVQFEAGASGRAGGGSTFEIRSPIDGTLVEIGAASGETIEEGKLIFRVIDLSTVWVTARIFEPDIPKIEGATSAWFTVEGRERPFEIGAKNGKLVTIGRVIDPQTRTVPVIFELADPEGLLRIGQFAKVHVAIGEKKPRLAIPDSAIVREAGRPVAFVQLEGEAFERRPLRTGVEDRGWVEVLEGVTAGERVVARGAYEVKLASSAGAVPAHGHVH